MDYHIPILMSATGPFRYCKDGFHDSASYRRDTFRCGPSPVSTFAGYSSSSSTAGKPSRAVPASVRDQRIVRPAFIPSTKPSPCLFSGLAYSLPQFACLGLQFLCYSQINHFAGKITGYFIFTANSSYHLPCRILAAISLAAESTKQSDKEHGLAGSTLNFPTYWLCDTDK